MTFMDHAVSYVRDTALGVGLVLMSSGCLWLGLSIQWWLVERVFFLLRLHREALLFIYCRGRPNRMSARMARMEAAMPDPAKLRILADWIDRLHPGDPNPESQSDLRRWADHRGLTASMSSAQRPISVH